MERSYLFTSESVTEGHPDKIADQISDAVLDQYLEVDGESRVACEVMITTNTVYVTGEISSKGEVDIESVVRTTLRDIGYTSNNLGIDADECDVIVNVDEQSPDIARGVDVALESRGNGEENLLGAGDQGLMFGYATNETEAYLPYPIYYAHKLAKKLTEVRKKLPEWVDYLRPDGKTQVTVRYEDGKVKEIDTIVISIQHGEQVTQEELENFITENVIKEVIDEKLITENTKIFINPSGRFVIGGPNGDVGLTGRKIIVDTYGGRSRHGGGAFCVDKDTEYLTLNGWKKIDKYTEGDLVAQWDDGVVTYVEPLEYIEADADKMYQITDMDTLDMVLSENHDIVYVNEKGINKIRLKDILDVINSFSGNIPLSFRFGEKYKQQDDFLESKRERIIQEGGITKYYTEDKEEADLIQLILTSKLNMGVIIKELRSFDGDRYYEVQSTNKRYGRLDKVTINVTEFVPEDGKMYCFSVPSEMLVLRRNNRIFVTGNSGKDATKVDRSASYVARYIAKNVVAAELADECEVQLAYAIGKAQPVSVYVNTFGTAKEIKESEIEEIVMNLFRMDPKGIIEELQLTDPIYKQTAAYGHFGRDEFTWEKLDKVDVLLKEVEKLRKG